MKFLKITLYAMLYLILCLIILPIIVNIINLIIGFKVLSSILSVIIKIFLALQISRQINKVTQVFPNFLKRKNFQIKNSILAQAFWYVIYFSLIFITSYSLNKLSLDTSILALIISTLLKLLITYLIANIIRYIISLRKEKKVYN